MQTVTVSFQVGKESKEVVDAVSSIVEHFVAGKSVDQALALLPAVMQAVDGYQKIAEEVKSQVADETAGYLVHKVLGVLRSKVVAVPAEA